MGTTYRAAHIDKSVSCSCNSIFADIDGEGARDVSAELDGNSDGHD